LRKAEKFDINNVVPAVSGIYELYFMDEKRGLNILKMDCAWYGGLRNTLRNITDPLPGRQILPPELLKIYDCYYRYTQSDSYNDMNDVLFFFQGLGRPVPADQEHSGRYNDIYVKEISPDKVVTI
jgi:hypothetical protein